MSVEPKIIRCLRLALTLLVLIIGVGCAETVTVRNDCTGENVRGKLVGSRTTDKGAVYQVVKVDDRLFTVVPGGAIPLGWDCDFDEHPKQTKQYIYLNGPYKDAKSICDNQNGTISGPIREDVAVQAALSGDKTIPTPIAFVRWGDNPYTTLIQRDGSSSTFWFSDPRFKQPKRFRNVLSTPNFHWECAVTSK